MFLPLDFFPYLLSLRSYLVSEYKLVCYKNPRFSHCTFLFNICDGLWNDNCINSLFFYIHWSVNLIKLINKNQESKIRVKTWKNREAEQQPQSLPTSSILPFKRAKISTFPFPIPTALLLPVSSLWKPPDLYGKLMARSVLWLQESFVCHKTMKLSHNS